MRWNRAVPLAAAVLAASCGDGATAPEPPADPTAAAAAHPGTVAAPRAAEEPSPASAPTPRRPRRPVPAPPADTAARHAGLISLLERGDSAEVAFAQAVLAMDPDPATTGARLAAAARANLRRNTGLVCNIVGAIRSREMGAPMAEVLREATASEDPSLRRLALSALAAHAPPVDPEIAARLAADPLYTVALDAIEVIRLTGTREAGAALLAVLPRIHATPRPFALSVIGMLRPDGAEAALRAALARARGEGAAVHGAAAGDGVGGGGRPDDPSLLGEVGAGAALGAATGLAHLGDEAGIEGLRAWVRSLPESLPPGTAEEILARRGETWIRDRLAAQCVTAPPAAAAPAIPLLLHFRDHPEARAAVLVAWERPDWEVLLEATTFLHALDPADGMRRALADLVSVEQDRRYAAALALGRFRDPASVEPLARRLLEDPSGGVRTKIADALGILADPRAAPALVEHLRTDTAPSPDLAWQAFNARTNLRGAVAVAAAPLLAALLDRGLPPSIGCHALRALGAARGAAEARPALERRLRDASAEMRRSAAIALGDLGDDAARPVLVARHAEEPDDGVADEIAGSILRLDLVP